MRGDAAAYAGRERGAAQGGSCGGAGPLAPACRAADRADSGPTGMLAALTAFLARIGEAPAAARNSGTLASA
jgi:hypothetical protein